MEQKAKTPEGDRARWRPHRRSRGGSSSAPRKAEPFAEILSGVYTISKLKDFFSGLKLIQVLFLISSTQ
ncbi:hypothetical protein FZC76_01830 [Sutcliffiella horikoshii]|uniref:Uncharacterized protein n=1 Tax=Sutcliffiella horikoshii TaxID=79883 RepID=A0A5D4T8V8_9BACI|nr:hypothetical protein FZC76_01830 [Sutcliffiella horikoshii]